MIVICSILNLLGLFYYLYYKDPFYLFILVLLNVYFLFKLKNTYLISMFIFVIGYFYFNQRLIIHKPSDNIYHVVKVNEFDYIIQNKQATVLLKTESQLSVNDKIQVNQDYQLIHSIDNVGLFSYSTYLKSKGIFYQISMKEVKLLEKSNDTSNLNLSTKTNHYFNYIFLQDKSDMNKEVITSLVSLGIVHAFVVSGLHFNKLHSILTYSLFFIKNKWLHYVLVMGILFGYLYLLNFSLPALKAFYLLVFLKYKDKQLILLSLLVLGIILINPYILLSFSFILTMVSSIALYLISYFKIESNYTSSLVMSLLMLPIITNINYEISIFCFIFNILFEKILISFFTIILLGNAIPLLTFLSDIILTYFEKAIAFLSNINILINTGYFSLPVCFIYYIVILLVLKYKKLNLKCLFVTYMIVIVYLPRPYTTVTFLNVGQADTIVIIPSYSKKAIIIDPGQPKYAKTIQNITLPYLKANRVNEIETIFISHEDADHAGGLEELKESISINNIVRKKDKLYKSNHLEFVDVNYDKVFKDMNQNSMTLYTQIHGLKFLFTGDIDKTSELEMFLKIEQLPVDVLKVAHHGSKTSSSQNFLDITQPKIGIISSGYQNSYGHPHQEVVKRLEENQIDLYNTANDGSITFYLTDFFYFIHKMNK